MVGNGAAMHLNRYCLGQWSSFILATCHNHCNLYRKSYLLKVQTNQPSSLLTCSDNKSKKQTKLTIITNMLLPEINALALWPSYSCIYFRQICKAHEKPKSVLKQQWWNVKNSCTSICFTSKVTITHNRTPMQYHSLVKESIQSLKQTSGCSKTLAAWEIPVFNSICTSITTVERAKIVKGCYQYDWTITNSIYMCTHARTRAHTHMCTRTCAYTQRNLI